HQLQQMWYNVRFRLAVSLLDLAKLLPSGSPDRASHLLDAWDMLRQLAGGLPGEAMTWHSRVFLAECSRLRGELDRAVDLLDKITGDKPPKDVADRVVAEKARVLLALKKPTDAAPMLLDYGKQGGLSGELHFLNTRVLIALWEIAEDRRDRQTAAGLLEQIELRVERADREIGGYWGHRCRLLLETARETRRYGIDLAPLARKARTLYAEGNVDEAIEQYGAAAMAADRAGKPQLAMELGYTRASIQLESKRYQQAAEDFHTLAQRFPAEKQAAGAHLLWAYCLGKLYDRERTDQRRQAYAAALAGHREKFANDPTNVEATWLLARLEETTGQVTRAFDQVTRALELYHEIPATDRHGPQAQVGASRCYERILELLRESKQATDAWERTTIDRLGEIVGSFPGEPANLTREQAEVILRLARILLNRLPPESAAADRLLGRVFSTWQRLATGDDSPDKTLAAAWKPLLKTAAQLRIITLAGQPDPGPQHAASLIRDLSESSTGEVLGVLDGLMQLAKHTDEVTQRSLGELQLQAAQGLNQRRSEMNADERNRLDHCWAQAYVATGQPRRAIGVYEALVEQSPRDKRLRRTLAELLMRRGTAEFLKKAKSSWRKLETLEKAGSPQWLDTRYHFARCAFDLQEYEECRKLLGVTKLLYPDLGTGELRARFKKLENDLKEARGSR
ncbi:MAG: CDC27 family protein, partial [Planctomycetota bacterium]